MIGFIINGVMLILFKSSINIESASASPVFLLFLSAFMSAYYYTNRKKADFSTNYYSNIGFTEEEWERVSIYTARVNAAALPLYIPFVFFFPLRIKILVSVLIFMISMIGGAVFYRLKFRKELNSRFEKERKELEDQKKLEELGKWKQ